MARTACIESVIKPEDFDHIWDYLEAKFGYSKLWRHTCYEYVFNRQPVFDFYKPNPVADFIFFCRREIDPLLNAALCRHEYYPTFMRMMYWMFQDRIERRR